MKPPSGGRPPLSASQPTTPVPPLLHPCCNRCGIRCWAYEVATALLGQPGPQEWTVLEKQEVDPELRAKRGPRLPFNDRHRRECKSVSDEAVLSSCVAPVLGPCRAAALCQLALYPGRSLCLGSQVPLAKRQKHN